MAGEEVNDEDYEDDDEGVDYDTLEMITNSTDWTIARTVYGTMQLGGKIKIDNVNSTHSELSARFTNAALSKLDIHKGHPDDEIKIDQIDTKDEEFDEEDGDSSDDDEDADFDDSRTAEGGIIQALFNMQLRQLAKNYLPEIK